MDDQRQALSEKRDRLLKELAEVEVALSRVDGSIAGIPHYSVIELAAHERGRQLSCEIQKRQMAEAAALAPRRSACPGCGTLCELKPVKRDMTSIDGQLQLQDLRGFCSACRRAFFPLAGTAGL